MPQQVFLALWPGWCKNLQKKFTETGLQLSVQQILDKRPRQAGAKTYVTNVQIKKIFIVKLSHGQDCEKKHKSRQNKLTTKHHEL